MDHPIVGVYTQNTPKQGLKLPDFSASANKDLYEILS